MRFLELAQERYSVRSYSDRPVEQEKIDLILKAAQLAPTAVNYQPQMIYVLKATRHSTRSTVFAAASMTHRWCS